MRSAGCRRSSARPRHSSWGHRRHEDGRCAMAPHVGSPHFRRRGQHSHTAIRPGSPDGSCGRPTGTARKTREPEAPPSTYPVRQTGMSPVERLNRKGNMDMHHTTGRHQLGLAITAAVAVGVAMTGSAAAAEPIGSSGVSADALTVVGTQGADRLALRLAPGDPSTLQVDFGDDGSPDQTFNRSTFSHIDVFLLSGDDEFRVDQINGTFADDPVTVDAGRGDDIVATGAGNDRVLGGP